MNELSEDFYIEYLVTTMTGEGHGNHLKRCLLHLDLLPKSCCSTLINAD